MTPETLTCARCHKEVRIVRLNKTTLAFGHRQNPGPGHHMVRLARAARNGIPVPTELPEGPALRHRKEVPTGSAPQRREEALAPSLMTNGTRPASKGRSRTALPLGSPSKSERRGRARVPSAAAQRSPGRPVDAATSPLGLGPTAPGRG